MGAPLAIELDAQIERRFVRLAQLARAVSAAPAFGARAGGVAAAFGAPLAEANPPAVRLWAITSDGVEELARVSSGRELPHVPVRELQRLAVVSAPTAFDGR